MKEREVGQPPSHRLRHAAFGALGALCLILLACGVGRYFSPEEFKVTTEEARDLLKCGTKQERCNAMGELQHDAWKTIDALREQATCSDAEVARVASTVLSNLAKRLAESSQPK